MGTVFKLNAHGTLTILYSFTGPDGNQPVAALVEDRNGNFYGTTASGGVDNQGTIFRIDSSGVLASLHKFSTADGAHPQGAHTLASDGNLHGTTADGGASGFGTLFKLDSTGTLTTIHSFAQLEDGGDPYAPPVEASDGYLYGTTPYGGRPSSVGVIYRIKCDFCIQPRCTRCPREVSFR